MLEIYRNIFLTISKTCGSAGSALVVFSVDTRLPSCCKELGPGKWEHLELSGMQCLLHSWKCQMWLKIYGPIPGAYKYISCFFLFFLITPFGWKKIQQHKYFVLEQNMQTHLWHTLASLCCRPYTTNYSMLQSNSLSIGQTVLVIRKWSWQPSNSLMLCLLAVWWNYS